MADNSDTDNNISINHFHELVTVLKLGNQNMSQLINQITTRLGAQSPTNALNGITNLASSGTVVVINNGYLTSISVTVASSATSVTGKVYDANTIVGLGSSCTIGIIPSSGVTAYNWPFTKGLVIQTGSSNQTVAVSYVLFPTTARSS